MKGLPRAQDTSRPRDLMQVVLFSGIERLTESLRRGDPYDERSLVEMQQLQRRLEKFSEALNARMHHAYGDGEVLEDE